jgi:hypothetical protein
MYCWPPLPLIYIEEGECPFIMVIMLFSLYLSSRSTSLLEIALVLCLGLFL